MNFKTSSIRGAVFVAMFATAPAFADTMLVTDHNATAGPKHDALMNCASAAAHSSLGHGLLFSGRQHVARTDADGGMTVILTGTSWQGGERVPVTARCVTGHHQEVASLTIVNAKSQVADTK